MKVHLQVDGAPAAASASAAEIEQIAARFGEHADEVCCYFPGHTPAASDVADLIGALQRVPALP